LVISSGIIYIAIGQQAQNEAEKSITSFRQYNDLPVTVLGSPVNGYTNKQASRWTKLNLDVLTEYEKVLYLDADTRIHGDLTIGFNFLDGFDMAIAPSTQQDSSIFAHIGADERLQTITEIGYLPLQLQAGVMFFHRERCAEFFKVWRQEWLRWQEQDQAAMLRALKRYPLRIWLLGRDWNGGKLVDHLFGRCR
jgi:hypothetical protein